VDEEESMFRRASAIVLCLLLPTAALAQLIYPLQHERYVQTHVSLTSDDPNQPDLRLLVGPGFDLWQGDVCIESVCGRTASAGQYSELTGTTLDAFGAADLRVTPTHYDQPVSEAQNYARFRFAVSEPVTLDLVGYISVEAMAEWVPYWWTMSLSVTVQVNRIAGEIAYEESAGLSMSDGNWSPDQLVEAPLVFADELDPGVYELTVSTVLHAETSWEWGGPVFLGEASYVVSAELAPVTAENPAEADLDGDGDVDIADYARFQRAFSGPLLGN
jgi:hypothetical protein